MNYELASFFFFFRLSFDIIFIHKIINIAKTAKLNPFDVIYKGVAPKPYKFGYNISDYI